ncbi:helix-turn-helix domain-containing protein [Providencia stuartii]|uniref:helix-turn-helix domain-containing protein n=1 Tax=Providencia TaxID=586 RepID=UPI0013A7504C|nr:MULTISPECIES: helix-turn-helix domain-containing protein [Providencia]MBQ0456030.1 helix-turn-helix domain-containing protein [Providencia stuartii]QIB29847.1 helix-turn-helix domain-containing protein [Providencia stuartii]QPN42154.1 helix-turn-helix domain-containing protein [Providencia sp. 2.29]WAZ77137.1 helix-turn-helix domain-containing protein [Providencia stuartii]WAZ81714.1 helix-turn-helix domain-containing protein [Providencia stuartii]
MSMTLMAKAMSIKVGNPLRKLVLIKLADNANDKGECWPSYQHIAEHCECSKSAVRTHIEALIDMGLLVKENRLGINNGKGNTSNIYYLDLSNPMSSKSIAPMPPKSIAISNGDSPVPSKSIAMPPDGRPPMPSDGTRTSHSFEPVNEPIIEPNKSPLTPKGEKGEKKVKFDPLPAKPENVSEEVWQDWINFRKEIRKPLTETTCKQLAKKLAGCSDADAVLCNSIANGWQGIFPERIGTLQKKSNSHVGFADKQYGTQETPHWLTGGKNA